MRESGRCGYLPDILLVGRVPALWTVLLGLEPLKDALVVEHVTAGGAEKVVRRGDQLQAG